MNAPLLIIIPCLDEAAHLPDLIAKLCADPDAAHARIVVADGGSTDGGQDIVRGFSDRDPRVVLLDNPKRLQSAAVNLAVARFGAEAPMFIRMDAHAGYPPGFISSLRQAQSESGADSVTVAMIAKAHTGGCFQIANAGVSFWARAARLTAAPAHAGLSITAITR